jgi:putative MATE family efflux protein
VSGDELSVDQSEAELLGETGDSASRPVPPDPTGRLTAGRLAGLSMRSAIIVLSWPILAESVLNSLVGLTDTVLAAGIEDGGAAADAIGGASYILWFVGLIVAALGTGATAVIARSIGKRRLAVARAAVGQTFMLAVVSGVLVGAALALLADPTTRILNMSDAAAAAFRRFIWVASIGVPFSSVLYSMIACSRGAGDSLRPLVAMILVNIVNMASSWVLAGVDLKSTRLVDGKAVTTTILHNPFGFDLGVSGIAAGTVIGEFCGAAFITFIMIRGVSGVGLTARRLAPHRTTAARLIRLGWPNFLETAGMWFGNFLIILMVGWMGAGMLGAHIVAIRVESFSFLPGFAMGIASATLVGQYLGAGSPAMARRAVRICTLIPCATMGLTGLIFVLFPDRIVGLFTSQEAHLRAAPAALQIAGAVQIPFAVSLVLRSALRGAGDVRSAMWISWVCTYCVRLPLAYLCSGVNIPLPGWLCRLLELSPDTVIHNPSGLEPTLKGLWLGLCLEIGIRCALFAWRFAGGQWERARV